MQAKENKIHQEEEIMKKIIRLTESDLHRIVKEAVGYIYKMYDNTSPSPRTTVEDGIRKQTEKHRAESAKRRAKRNNDKKLETENTIISEVEGGALAGDSGAGMSLNFGGDSQPAEDKGATSSLRDKTYTAPFTKKKDKSLTRPKGNTTGIQDKADWNVNM